MLLKAVTLLSVVTISGRGNISIAKSLDTDL